MSLCYKRLVILNALVNAIVSIKVTNLCDTVTTTKLLILVLVKKIVLKSFEIYFQFPFLFLYTENLMLI